MDSKDSIIDVVVIGAGGAGLSAAIEAIKLGLSVRVLTQGSLLDGKTANAQGGVQASMAKGDSPENHIQDTLKAGNFKSKPELVEVLARRAAETIRWLENCGVRFDRDGDEYLLSKAAGLSHARILSCGDSAGKGIVAAVSKTAFDAGVTVLEDCCVQNIEKHGKEFVVTSYYQPTNKDAPNNSQQCESRLSGTEQDEHLKLFRCRSVILATGGFLSEEKKAGLAGKQSQPSTPDGLELANRLGANIVSPELQQFHPTGVVLPKPLRRKRIPEVMRGDGATLLNRFEKKFADPLLTRNELSARIVEECKLGNGIETDDGRVGVWLDTPLVEKLHGQGYIANRYPTFHELFLKHEHDLAKKRVLVYPIVHYSLGGVEIDENALTCVPGLFAAGEVTWGVHGDDRLMGNSLLDIFVFGRIAGQAAAKFIQTQTKIPTKN